MCSPSWFLILQPTMGSNAIATVLCKSCGAGSAGAVLGPMLIITRSMFCGKSKMSAAHVLCNMSKAIWNFRIFAATAGDPSPTCTAAVPRRSREVQGSSQQSYLATKGRCRTRVPPYSPPFATPILHLPGRIRGGSPTEGSRRPAGRTNSLINRF